MEKLAADREKLKEVRALLNTSDISDKGKAYRKCSDLYLLISNLHTCLKAVRKSVTGVRIYVPRTRGW